METNVATTEAPAAPAAEETKALAPVRPAIPVMFDPGDPVALYMNTGVFEQLQRVAGLMAASELVPPHLRGKRADCFLVAAQAFRWRMDPFSVAQLTYVVQGRLGYEGKLIAALINASGKTEENLRPVYSGQKGAPDRKVTIVATLKGEREPRTVEGTVGEWRTKNDQWTSIPDQMLMYRGSREWARRHMPEVVLGIQAEEEVEPVSAATSRPQTLDALAERIETAAGVPQPIQAPDPEPPAATAPTLAAAPSAPERQPGEDGDEETMRTFVEATAPKSAKGQQRRIVE